MTVIRGRRVADLPDLSAAAAVLDLPPEEAMRAGEVATEPENNVYGRYRRVAEIGRGGMGEVYLALHSGPAGFEKLVVLKTLRPEFAQEPRFVEMFLDEARLAARLSHPNIVQTNEVGIEGDVVFMAMEFLDGKPLSTLRRRFAKKAPEKLRLVEIRVLSEALLGLHHAHELADTDGRPLHVVHRDASPQNIFLTYDGVSKVVDFGIAKARNVSHETATGELKGKVRYMAPEQALARELDRRVDVFAVGILLWESLSGKRFWGSELNDTHVLLRLVEGRLPSIREHCFGVPEPLLRVCERAVAFDREDRFSTALEFHEAIETALDEEPAWRMSQKHLLRFLAEELGDERRALRARVDKELARVRTLVERESARGLVVSLPVLALDGTTGDSNSGQRVSSVTTAPGGAHTMPKKRATAPAALAVTVLALATAFGAFALRRAYRTTMAASSAGVVEAATAAPQSAPTASLAPSVRIQISTTAPSAVVSLDGEPPVRAPLQREVARASGGHTVRVEAQGFATRELMVAGDVDSTTEVNLVHLRPVGSPAPQSPVAPPSHAKLPHPVSSAPPPGTASAPDPAPTSTPVALPVSPPPASSPSPPPEPTRKRRDIGRDNPYE